jgi:hypothetical protein
VIVIPVILTRAIGTSMTSHARGEHPDRELLFLQELTRARVAGDVVEIASGTWVIHGDIPVDRDVIMAEFETYDEARIALDAFFRRSAGNTLDLISQRGNGPLRARGSIEPSM